MIAPKDLLSLEIRETPSGITVSIRVQPRSSRNAVTGVVGEALKINLTSPPVEGEANQACIAFFADTLAIAKNRIVIVSGFKGRNKTIAIHGMTKEKFLILLSAALFH